MPRLVRWWRLFDVFPGVTELGNNPGPDSATQSGSVWIPELQQLRDIGNVLATVRSASTVDYDSESPPPRVDESHDRTPP